MFIHACLKKVAITRWCSRKSYDGCIYFIVLKWRARVPSHDTFVARRTAGPGLASTYFYQISVEQALAALDVHLEHTLITSYMAYIEKRLNEPVELYTKILNPIFDPYSYKFNSSHVKERPYQFLSEQVNNYVSKYRSMGQK